MKGTIPQVYQLIGELLDPKEYCARDRELIFEHIIHNFAIEEMKRLEDEIDRAAYERGYDDGFTTAAEEHEATCTAEEKLNEIRELLDR